MSPKESPPPLSHDPVHDDVLARLGKRFRGPMVRMHCELRHPATRQIYRRDFAYLSLLLHALESSRRVQGLPRGAVAEALATVSREGDRVRGRLHEIATQMHCVISRSSQAETPVEFVRPGILQVTIVSPCTRDYLVSLELADDAFSQVERAWLLALITLSDKQQQAAECRKALQSFKQAVREQRNRIGALVQAVNAARVQAGREPPKAEQPAPPRPGCAPPELVVPPSGHQESRTPAA